VQRESRNKSIVESSGEDVDEKVSTAAVDLDAPSAVVEVVEKTATISNRSFMETTKETTQVEQSDIPIDDNDKNQDDVEVIDEHKIAQLEEEAGAEEETKRTDS